MLPIASFIKSLKVKQGHLDCMIHQREENYRTLLDQKGKSAVLCNKVQKVPKK